MRIWGWRENHVGDFVVVVVGFVVDVDFAVVVIVVAGVIVVLESVLAVPVGLPGPPSCNPPSDAGDHCTTPRARACSGSDAQSTCL